MSAPRAPKISPSLPALQVDRSAAYAARWVAKSIVASGLAKRAIVQVLLLHTLPPSLSLSCSACPSFSHVIAGFHLCWLLCAGLLVLCALHPPLRGCCDVTPCAAVSLSVGRIESRFIMG